MTRVLKMLASHSHVPLCENYAFTHVMVVQAKAHSQGHSHTSVKKSPYSSLRI